MQCVCCCWCCLQTWGKQLLPRLDAHKCTLSLDSCFFWTSDDLAVTNSLTAHISKYYNMRIVVVVVVLVMMMMTCTAWITWTNLKSWLHWLKVWGYIRWTFKVYSISTTLPINNYRSFFFYLNIFVFRNMTSFGIHTTLVGNHCQ